MTRFGHLSAIGAVALLLSTGCAASSLHRSAQAGAKGGPAVCNLSQLRVTRAALGVGSDTLTAAANHLIVRFVNDGHPCTIDRRSLLTVTATTNTGVLIRAKLPDDSYGTLRVGPHQTATFDFGTGWNTAFFPRDGSQPQPIPCHYASYDSVVFHSKGSSKTVSLGRHPIGICTPVQSTLLLSRSW